MGNSHREETGCGTCGGYGVVLVKKACKGCGRESWVRPGVFTSYEGKEYYTVDGLKMFCHGHTEHCLNCEESLKVKTGSHIGLKKSIDARDHK